MFIIDIYQKVWMFILLEIIQKEIQTFQVRFEKKNKYFGQRDNECTEQIICTLTLCIDFVSLSHANLMSQAY